MRISHSLPYRYADAVLQHDDFRAAYEDLIDVLERTPVPLLNVNEMDPKKGGVKRRKRSPLKGGPGPRYFFLPVDQKALNAELNRSFSNPERGWEAYPYVVEQNGPLPRAGLRADFKRANLQVEIQFGNMARWYSDVFKFQLSYSQGLISAAVLVVPTQAFANLIDENVAQYERVARELPWAKMSLTLPILVLGVEPEDWTPVRNAYTEYAENFRRYSETDGKIIVPIPYEQRIQEVDPDEEEEEQQPELLPGTAPKRARRRRR